MSLLGRRIKHGMAAEAQILRMAPTAKAAREEGRRNVEFRFRLRVESERAGTHEVDHTERVPWDKLPATGQRLPVTVSASDPSRLRIEWDEVGSTVERFQAAGEAAERGDAGEVAEALGFELADPKDDS